MLFIFDTNILVSAIIKPDSVPAQALAKATQHGRLAFSEETRIELLNTLSNTKFDRYRSATERVAVADAITAPAFFSSSIVQEDIYCRDQNDTKFLLLAISAKATCIVTGDKDLTALNPFRGIPILTPTDFLSWNITTAVLA